MSKHRSRFKIKLANLVRSYKDLSTLRPSCPNIYTLYQGIREAFERRAEYHLPDSMGYFYDHIDRISLPDYVPTQQDILYCRKTTKGINEFRMFISNVPFLFVDVGGQRTQVNI